MAAKPTARLQNKDLTEPAPGPQNAGIRSIEDRSYRDSRTTSAPWTASSLQLSGLLWSVTMRWDLNSHLAS